jgi:hypothetical protein
MPPPVDIDSRFRSEAVVDVGDPLVERHRCARHLHRHRRERVATDRTVVPGAEHEAGVERVDLDVTRSAW